MIAHHPPRLSQIVDPRDGLLAAIATFVQVYRPGAGATDPADLVRDGPLIGVHTQPGSQGRHAVRLVGPCPGGADPGRGQPFDPGAPVRPGHQQVELDGVGGGRRAPDEAARDGDGQLTGQRGDAQHVQDGGFGQLGSEQRQHRKVGRVGRDLCPEYTS